MQWLLTGPHGGESVCDKKKKWCLLILLRYFYQELKWYPHPVVILSCLKKDSQSAAKFYMGFSIVKRFLKGKEIQNHRSNV